MNIIELLSYEDYPNYCYMNDTRKIEKNMDDDKVKELLKEAKYYLKDAPKHLKRYYILSYIVLVNMFKDKEKILNTMYNTPIFYKKGYQANELCDDDSLNLAKGFTKYYENGYSEIYLGDVYQNEFLDQKEILNNFLHELRHVLSINKNNIGLMHNKHFVSIEEVYNTYFTEILINNIISLNYNNINDLRLKCFLKKLTSEYYYHVLGYREEMLLTNPIILNKELTKEINKMIFNGKNEDARKLFPYFEEYANILDEISYDMDTKIDVPKILEFKDNTRQIAKLIK